MKRLATFLVTIVMLCGVWSIKSYADLRGIMSAQESTNMGTYGMLADDTIPSGGKIIVDRSLLKKYGNRMTVYVNWWGNDSDPPAFYKKLGNGKWSRADTREVRRDGVWCLDIPCEDGAVYVEYFNHAIQPSDLDQGWWYTPNHHEFSYLYPDRDSFTIEVKHDWHWKWYTENGIANAYKQLTDTYSGDVKGEKVYRKCHVAYTVFDFDTGVELDNWSEQVNAGTYISCDGSKDSYGGLHYRLATHTNSHYVGGDDSVTMRAEAIDYDISFNGNGGTRVQGSVVPLLFPYKGPSTLPGAVYERPGYAMTGWSKKESGGSVYKCGESVSYIKSRPNRGGNHYLTLYAQWKPTTSTVTYQTIDYDNNKVLATETKTVDYGTHVRGDDTGTTDETYNGLLFKYVDCEDVPRVTGDVVVKRIMRTTQYRVHFDGKGGGSVSDLVWDGALHEYKSLPNDKFKTKYGDWEFWKATGHAGALYQLYSWGYYSDDFLQYVDISLHTAKLEASYKQKRTDVTYVFMDCDNDKGEVGRTVRVLPIGDKHAASDVLGRGPWEFNNKKYRYTGNDVEWKTALADGSTVIHVQVMNEAFRLEFNPLGGTGSIPGMDCIADVKTKYALPDYNIFKRPGEVATSWYANTNEGRTLWLKYPGETTFDVWTMCNYVQNGVITLTPWWKPTIRTVTYQTVDYDNNNVLATETKTIDYGTHVRGDDIGITDETYDGLLFRYKSCDDIPSVSGDVTVKRYMTTTQYRVHFDANGGEGSVPDQIWDGSLHVNKYLPFNGEFTKKYEDVSQWRAGLGGSNLIVYSSVYADDCAKYVQLATHHIRFYAQWKITRADVTYSIVNVDGGKELAREHRIKTIGSYVNAYDIWKDNITYDGVDYIHVGNTNGEYVKNDGTTVICTALNRLVRVKFDSGKDAAVVGEVPDMVCAIDKHYTMPDPNTFKKKRYTALGWGYSTDAPVLTYPYPGEFWIYSGEYARIKNGEITMYPFWQQVECSLDFNTGTSQVLPTQTAYRDKEVGELPLPVKPKNMFLNWQGTSKDGKTTFPVYSTSTVECYDQVLTAVWKEGAVDVTYMSPSKVRVIQGMVGEVTTAPFVPEELHRVFTHWSLTEDGPPYDFNTPLTNDLTLYAVFEGNIVHVELFGVGQMDRKFGRPFGDIPNPSQTGKEFEGWYYDALFAKRVNSTDKVLADPITIYPNLVDSSYDLTLQGRTEAYKMTYQGRVPELPVPTADTKTFKYWSYEGKPVKAGDTYIWDKSVELIPVWDTIMYSVTYPDGTLKLVEAGSKLGTLPEAPNINGKVFSGYLNQMNETIDPDTTVNKNIVVRFNYTNQNITLTLVDGDWNTKIAQEAGVLFTGLPKRERTGYYFSGWSMHVDGKATAGPVYEDTTLYAVFSGDYQNIYLTDLNMTVQKKTGSLVGSLPSPKKEGFDFDGWYEGSNKITAATTVPSGGMTLTAQFTPINIDNSDTVEVRYWSDGVKINTVDLPKGEILYNPGSPELKSVDDRKFMYWSVHEGGTEYTFGGRVDQPVDLYAQWN